MRHASLVASNLERVDSAKGHFEAVERLSLSAHLDEPLPPTLCFSDTHLVPRPLEWSDDAPDELLALIEALPEHAIIALGDLTESVGLGRADRDRYLSSERLASLFRAMTSRGARLVVGNHDANAVSLLEGLFGARNVFRGGFALGRIAVRHGHEASPLRTWAEARVGALVIPAYERLRRGRPPARLDNEVVLGSIRGGAPYVLFGHTHSAMLDPRAANPGCFLRSAQSFLTLSGYDATLFRRS